MLDILHGERGHAQRYPSSHIAAESGSRAFIGERRKTGEWFLVQSVELIYQAVVFPSARRAQFTRASPRGGDCARGGGLLPLNLSKRFKSWVLCTRRVIATIWTIRRAEAGAWSTARPGHEGPLANPGVRLHQCLGPMPAMHPSVSSVSCWPHSITEHQKLYLRDMLTLFKPEPLRPPSLFPRPRCRGCLVL